MSMGMFVLDDSFFGAGQFSVVDGGREVVLGQMTGSSKLEVARVEVGLLE